MEGKSDDTQVSRVCLSQGKAEYNIHNQVVLARSQGRLSMIAQIIEGRGWHFNLHTMNSIDTWINPCKINRIIIHQRSGGSQRIRCEYRHSIGRRKNAKASGDGNIGIIRCLSTRESCFPEWKVDAIIHTDLSVAGNCKGDEHV